MCSQHTPVGTTPNQSVAKRLESLENKLEDSLTKEIDDILGEIEAVRLEAQRQTNADDEIDHRTLKVTEGLDARQHKHYEKPAVTGCALSDPGPKETTIRRNFYTEGSGKNSKDLHSLDHGKRRGRGKVCTLPPRCDPPPSPPPCRTSTPWNEVKEPPLAGENRLQSNPSQADPYDQHQPEGDDHLTVLPSRPTICHFAPTWSSPFDRYRKIKKTPEVVRPPPFRPVHDRLGLSKEAFDALLTAEIDEVLVSSEEERRRAKARDFEGPIGESSTPAAPLIPLTKEDCLAFFRKNGYPDANSPGSLWGMYWWAADLGRSKFNFDFDFDKDDISILDAYG